MKENEDTNFNGRIERINEAVAYLKGKRIVNTQKDIANFLEIDTGNLSKVLKGNENYLTEPFLKKFANMFGLNSNWLLTGKGEICSSELKNVLPENIERVPSNRKTFDPIIDIQTIPVYDSTASLGIVEIFSGSEKGNVLSYLSIPNLPKSDGAIFMTGDSMYPLLKSGDIVALKIINPLDIIYGEMYYVEYFGEDESSEFKVIKYVKKSTEGIKFIQLVSYNQHHEPKDILINRIKTIAIVNASVRYNRL